MHEGAIAEGILSIALDYLHRNKGAVIGRVGLKLGELSGVEEYALRTAWLVVTRGTAAENSALVINRIPLVGRCHNCEREAPIGKKMQDSAGLIGPEYGPRLMPYSFVCPFCGEPLEVISGREMQVDYLDIE